MPAPVRYLTGQRFGRLLVVVAACTAPDVPPDADVPVPVDARDDGFGEPCTFADTSPIETCKTSTDVIGWCVPGDTERTGTCRRGCIDESCPDDQVPVPFGDAIHCYCMP